MLGLQSAGTGSWQWVALFGVVLSALLPRLPAQTLGCLLLSMVRQADIMKRWDLTNLWL